MAGTTSAPKHRRQRLQPYRRWPRRVLVGVNVAVALCVVAAGSVYGYVRYTIASIHTQPVAGLSPPEARSPEAANGLPPENILLIGNQSRIGTNNPAYGSAAAEGAALSDVTMILHLDPRTRRATILSIPRDLFVPMPAGSLVGQWAKINAALNDGTAGPENLIKAIHEDFGIPINHYVEVDFSGFLRTVNALGGIRLDFPMRLYDPVSDLGIYHTGCQLIRGPQALALVRSRHLQYDPPGVSPAYPPAWPADPESDLSRIVRTHIFLRVLLSTAQRKGLSNPFTAASFVNALIDQVTIDPGLSAQLLPLVRAFRHLAPGSLQATTLPVTAGGALNGYYYGGYNYGDVLFPTQPADMRAIEQWDPHAFSGLVAPSRVIVEDAAGTGTAALTAAALTRDGLPVASTGVLPPQSTLSETLVRFHPGQELMGLDVERRLSGAVIMQAAAGVRAGTVEVVLGNVVGVTGGAAGGSASGITGGGAGGSATTALATSPPKTARPTAAATVPLPSGTVATVARDALAPWDPRPC